MIHPLDSEQLFSTFKVACFIQFCLPCPYLGIVVLWFDKSLVYCQVWCLAHGMSLEYCKYQDPKVVSKEENDKGIKTYSFTITNRIFFIPNTSLLVTQPVFACSKLIIKTLEQGVQYVQS